jgi:predicted CoA-substrate-specific enzyme activase
MEIYTLGIDAGSTTTKAVLFVDNHIAGSALTFTAGDIGRAAKTVLEELGVQNFYRSKGLGAVVTTGSGRGMLAELCRKKFKGLKCQSVTEITCHGTGAFFIYPRIRMVVDIGGQDSKVIKMSDLGTVEAFVMNDKCAAGTGRFFEVIADVLDLRMEQLVQMALRARSSVEITNTCAVFAESEIISHLAAGKSKASILSGLHKSMADRIFALVRGLGIRKPVVMTGGVANNKAMVRALENRIGERILVAPDPQLVGALGAAIMAKNIADD